MKIKSNQKDKDSIQYEYAKKLGYYNWQHLVSYNTQNGNFKHLEEIIFHVNNLVQVLNCEQINQRELFYKFYN